MLGFLDLNKLLPWYFEFFEIYMELDFVRLTSSKIIVISQEFVIVDRSTLILRASFFVLYFFVDPIYAR